MEGISLDHAELLHQQQFLKSSVYLFQLFMGIKTDV